MAESGKIGIVVQARMGSSRLPGKALLPIVGKPLLRRLCDRVAGSRQAESLIVATSNQETDQAIADACRSWEIPVVRGPEKDLTTRLLQAARATALAALVRVTGDNPLTDPDGIDELITAFRTEARDYISNSHQNGYPYGTGAELVSIEALERCDKLLQTDDARENVMLYIRRSSESFSCSLTKAPQNLLRPQYYLTVDYPEDLEIVTEIYSYFDGRDDMSLQEIISFLDASPTLSSANAHLHEGYGQ